jgi:WD40 repeat protein
MRTRAVLGAALALTVALALGPSRAGPEGEASAERIDALIKQLGDRRFARREAASKELEGLGRPAFRALRRAAVASTDPEVRQRAERIMTVIGTRVPGLVQQAAEIHRIAWPGVHVYHTAFSPDGRHVLAGGDSGTVRLYEVKTGAVVRELAGPFGMFTPDGKQILSCSGDRTLHVWEAGTGKEVRKLDGPEAGIYSVDLTPDGKWVVTGRADGTLRLHEFATGKEVRKFEAGSGGCLGCFTPDGKQIFSACGRTLQLWDAATGKKLRTFEGHTAGLFGLFVLPGGKQGLSYSPDQTARVWDLATGKEVIKLNVGPNMSDIRGLALSPDGKRILVGAAQSNELRLIELTSGKEVHRFNLAVPARGVSFSRDGRLAATGTWRGFLHLLRMPGVFDED